MSANILDLFDTGNDSFDTDMVPDASPSYLNKRAPFDFDAVVTNAHFRASQKKKGTTYAIFEVEFVSGEGVHGDSSDMPGEEYREGDSITLIYDLNPPENQKKFVIAELCSVIDACVGADRPGVAKVLNSELGVTAASKGKLEDIVGPDVMDYAVKSGKGLRVAGFARLFASGLLDGAKINLASTGDANKGWYKYSAKGISTENDADAIRAALAVPSN